jgi:hypothetical protein
MNLRRLIGCCGVLWLCACATAPAYVEIPAGPVTIGSLQLEVDAGWNGPSRTPEGAVQWTRDGVLLDRVIVFSDIADGATLVQSASKQAAYPPFRGNMLPNEISALVEATLTKLYGEGDALVTSSGLRPQTFGTTKGFAFDVAVKLANGPDYRGLVGGFVANGKLELVVYLAAVPYYFDLHRERAANVIASARLGANP